MNPDHNPGPAESYDVIVVGSGAGALLTAARASDLGRNNKPIPGLFSIGNNSASVMGTSHPDAGGTLEPAMTLVFVLPTTLLPPKKQTGRGSSLTVKIGLRSLGATRLFTLPNPVHF